MLTHGPPYETLDLSKKGGHAGCRVLQKRMANLTDWRLHVFGHIHEAFGGTAFNGRVSVNAALPRSNCVVVVDLRK